MHTPAAAILKIPFIVLLFGIQLDISLQSAEPGKYGKQCEANTKKVTCSKDLNGDGRIDLTTESWSYEQSCDIPAGNQEADGNGGGRKESGSFCGTITLPNTVPSWVTQECGYTGSQKIDCGAIKLLSKKDSE